MIWVTVDGASSRDLDDAICVERDQEGWTVHVAIADLSYIVEIGSGLDREARTKGYTLYHAGGNTPMLPRAISEEQATLRAGSPRRVIHFSFKLDAELSVVDTKVARTSITVDHRLDHGTCLIAAAGKTAEGKMLRDALDLGRGLFERRRRAGAMVVFDAASGLLSDEDGILRQVGPRANAHLMIQELMVLTNAALARLMAKLDVHILFRNQRGKATASRPSMIEDAQLAASGLMDMHLFESKRTLLLNRADVGPYAEGHWSLNLPAYGWFTSPIRRYADLINHRILLAAVNGASSPYSLDELTAISSHLNGLAREDREASESSFKARAAHQAMRAMRQDGAEALSKSQMSQIVRVASQGGRLTHDSFTEIERRSAEQLLTSKDLHRLMTLTGADQDRARQIAIAHLVRSPEAAPSLLNHAANVAGWKVQEKSRPPKMERGKSIFTGSVILSAEGRLVENQAIASVKKTALQQALAGAMIKFIGGTPPPAWSMSAKTDPIVSSPKAKPDPVQKSPKSALLEFAQKRGIAPPKFETIAAGPGHQQTFSTIVSMKFEGRPLVASGEANSKKDAEARAAAALIEKLPA